MTVTSKRTGAFPDDDPFPPGWEVVSAGAPRTVQRHIEDFCTLHDDQPEWVVIGKQSMTLEEVVPREGGRPHIPTDAELDASFRDMHETWLLDWGEAVERRVLLQDARDTYGVPPVQVWTTKHIIVTDVDGSGCARLVALPREPVRCHPRLLGSGTPLNRGQHEAKQREVDLMRWQLSEARARFGRARVFLERLLSGGGTIGDLGRRALDALNGTDENLDYYREDEDRGTYGT